MSQEKNLIKLVTIGGGKGQARVLEGLKKYSYRLELSAIVSMVDNGGSTGRLREELGIPSFGGDFRDVLTSLSHNRTMIDLWQHRYERGQEIKGHSVGNLILLGLLEKSKWNIPEAIKIARTILDIKASVFPSTLDKVDLVAEYKDGDVIVGQDEIDNNLEKKFKTIKNIYTQPEAKAFEKAQEAIIQADALLLCPGDLYGSLLCNLIVPGIRESIKNSKAKIIYITNLMTKVNQTHNWTSSMFIKEVQKYLPKTIDYAIVNNGDLTSDISGQEQYKKEKWQMVENDIEEKYIGKTEVIQEMIWYEGKEFKRVSSDIIPRSFIRHDTSKIAEIVMGFFAL